MEPWTVRVGQDAHGADEFRGNLPEDVIAHARATVIGVVHELP